MHLFSMSVLYILKFLYNIPLICLYPIYDPMTILKSEGDSLDRNLIARLFIFYYRSGNDCSFLVEYVLILKFKYPHHIQT